MKKTLLSLLLLGVAALTLAQVTPTGRITKTLPPSGATDGVIGSSGPLADEFIPLAGFYIGNNNVGQANGAGPVTGYISTGSISVATTENQRQFQVPVACTAKNLYLYTNATPQPGTGSLTVVLRDSLGAVDTSLGFVIPAGAAANTLFSDLVNTASLTTGTTYTLKLVNAATSTATGTVTWGLQCTGATGYYIGNDGQSTGATASSTRFYPLSDSAPIATEASSEFSVPRDCTARNLFIRTNATQSATGGMVFTLRNSTGAADTAVTISLPANSPAGTYSDTVNTAALVAGTEYTLKVVNSATATGAGVRAWGFQCNTTPDVSRFVVNTSLSSATVPLSATRYATLTSTLSSTTPSSFFLVPKNCTAGRLFVRTSTAQSGTGAVTVTLLDSALASTALTLMVPAGAAAGSFSDVVNTVPLTAGSRYILSLVNAATATSAAFTSWSMECNP
jgi:hypothetical protein